MLRRTKPKSNRTKIAFAVPHDLAPVGVSLVGEFNGWDRSTHPMRKRSNGTRSVTLELETGRRWEYLYVTEEGVFFCDPEAEALVANPYGGPNSVITT